MLSRYFDFLNTRATRDDCRRLLGLYIGLLSVALALITKAPQRTVARVKSFWRTSIVDENGVRFPTIH